jgi:hypothetical protein
MGEPVSHGYSFTFRGLACIGSYYVQLASNPLQSDSDDSVTIGCITSYEYNRAIRAKQPEQR